MQIPDVLKTLSPDIRFLPTGSSYICNPVPEGADIDYIVCVSQRNHFEAWAYTNDFIKDGSPDYADLGFDSYVRDEDNLNLIVVDDPNFYAQFWAATVIAKQRNLLNRNERVNLFSEMLYGKSPLDS